MAKKPVPKDSPYRHCYNCGEIDWATMSPQCGTCGGSNFSTPTSKQIKSAAPKIKVVPPVWDESGRLVEPTAKENLEYLRLEKERGASLPPADKNTAGGSFMILILAVIAILFLYLAVFRPLSAGVTSISDWWNAQPSTGSESNEIPPYVFLFPFFIMLMIFIRNAGK